MLIGVPDTKKKEKEKEEREAMSMRVERRKT
jgi:hypothetical protein